MRKSAVTGAVLMLAAGLGAGAAEQNWISPSIHFNGAVGFSTADHVEDLAVGHHDPTRVDGTVQGLELGASLRMNHYVQGFATYALHYGADEKWEGEQEEAFLKLVNLPGGFELRGGRMLARFGAMNTVHPHGWDFVDMPLPAGLLLGDDGLILDGGDATWARRDRERSYGVTAGYGRAKSHDHGADHDDHSGTGPDAGEEEAGHGQEDDFGYARLFGTFYPDDFTRLAVGCSGAAGDGERGRQKMLYGMDVAYWWRENGFFTPGGWALRWTTELILKDERGEHGHGDHEDGGDGSADALASHADESVFGIYTQAVWSWNERWDTGLRLGYVERERGRDERFRASPVVTWRPLGMPAAALRLQYNYDDVGDTDEHTVWMQLGLSWGGPEVR